MKQQSLSAYDFMKKSLDELINNIAEIIEKNISEDLSKKFLNCCENSNYDKATEILNEVTKKVQNKESKEFAQKVDKTFSSLRKNINNLKNSKDRSDDTVNDTVSQISNTVNDTVLRNDNINIFLIFLGIGVLGVLGTLVYCKCKGKKLEDIFSNAFTAPKSSEKKIRFTEADEDMLFIVEELAEIYKKTEEYLDN